jgi:hypothetical protein
VGEEYYCEVKTADSYQRQISNVTTDNILMETFNLLLRPYQVETLEIILYQNEKKGEYKFSKEIKRIKHKIGEMGEQNIDGIKFTLAMNDPNITFPQHPPFINEKRYINIFVDKCINLPIMDSNGLSDPFVKISLNKEKENRYSDCTRVILKELNPIFKHTFHIPVYSLRDDIIIIEVFDYDKLTKCDEIGKIKFNVSELGYGIVDDKWHSISSGKIHLIIHLSDENEPSFISKLFSPKILNVKVFEIKESNKADKKSVSVHMKNDLFPKLNYITSINKSQTPQFSNAVFSIPISNTNDTYIIETINSSNSIESSDEFKTSDLEEGLIYRNNINGIRFWTQINQINQKPFISNNFDNYYNKIEECYTLHIEIIKMNNLPSSDSNGLSDPYYIANFGNQQFKSRVIYCNLNPVYYDEFKFKIKNL